MRLVPRRLAPRLILGLSLLVCVTTSTTHFLDVRAHRAQLLEEATKRIDELSLSINSATWQTMLLDHREAAYAIMETMGADHGIDGIRIFNKEGLITFSTNPDDPPRVDLNAEACVLCHAREKPLLRLETPSRARIYTAADGRRKMGMIRPIYNEPACADARCHAHPTSQRVLGVLDVVGDIEDIEQALARTQWRAVLAGTAEMALIAAFIALFVHFLVIVPIGRLTAATRAVADMQLDVPVDAATEGELGELAHSFDVMREHLKDAVGRLEDMTHDLERKVETRSAQLAETRLKLIQSDRQASLGQLAASVAHEINNPVAGVLNLSMLLQRLLREDGIPPGRVEEFRGYLASITEEVTRVGRIVSDLLSFSRRSSPQRRESNLAGIVESTVSLIAHKLELAGVRLELDFQPDLPPIHCDASQIQQVVINLVMNAAEASSEGGLVTVRLRFDDQEDAALLEVIDQGTGIDEVILNQIYDPFFTTKEAGYGVGLGLSVVAGIVESHGGSIRVRSAPGEGSTFTVRLPRNHAGQAETEAAS